MTNKPCISCKKPLNGGVYRKPNQCPHCSKLQDARLCARGKPAPVLAKTLRSSAVSMRDVAAKTAVASGARSNNEPQRIAKAAVDSPKPVSRKAPLATKTPAAAKATVKRPVVAAKPKPPAQRPVASPKPTTPANVRSRAAAGEKNPTQARSKVAKKPPSALSEKARSAEGKLPVVEKVATENPFLTAISKSRVKHGVNTSAVKPINRTRLNPAS